ncbi:MAG TPA: glycosyltransferase family 4 protein, partial [Tissierellia bacterium]|nr:glycosyltransferase family 4 protein [Tissierellia bacterium]
MNIIYIDHYAGSDRLGMEFRPYYIARELQQQGHQVLIIAGDYSHLRKVNPPIKQDYQVKTIEGVPFLFIKSGKYAGNGIARVRSMIRFVRKIIKGKQTILETLTPDAIITSSTYPFDTYAGRSLAKASGARLYHEIHDLWPMTPMELGGYSRYHPFIFTMQQAEIAAYKKSNKIISILPNAAQHVRELGLDTEVVYIPNGLPEAYFSDQQPADPAVIETIDRLKQTYQHVIGYAGGLSISNAMDYFIRSFQELTDSRIAGVIIGDGIEKTRLQQMVEEQQLPITFLDPIPKERIIQSLKAFDSLYLGSTRNKLYQYGFGMNKMFDYLMAEKPIVMSVDGSHSPIHDLGLALIAEPEDPADIA